MAELWNVAPPTRPTITGRRKVTTMATLRRTDALYHRRRKLARSGAYEFFFTLM